MQTAMAQRLPRPADPIDRPIRGDMALELTMCLKNLDNAQRETSRISADLGRAQSDVRLAQSDAATARAELDMCRRSSVDPRETDRLKRQNERLEREVTDLRRDNSDLRRQLDDMRPPQRPTEFFSYAACVDGFGTPDLRYIGAGMGILPIEAEANAMKNTQAKKSCSRGNKVVQTEAISFGQPEKYCTAACVDGFGTPDNRYSVGSRGRNATEASYLALEKAMQDHSCSRGVKVTACQ